MTIALSLAAVLVAAEAPMGGRLVAAGYAEVPVVRPADSYGWYADVSVGGKPARAFLDTGAGTSSVEADAVPRLTGARLVVIGRYTRLGSLHIGPLRLTDLSADILNMRDLLAHHEDRRRDLLLGTDVFAAGRAVFDFAAGKLYLLPADRTPPPGLGAAVGATLARRGWVPVPVVESVVSRMRYVRTVVNGRIVCLVVDSGAAADNLFADTARRLELQTEAIQPGGQATLAGRVDAYRPVRAGLRIGDASWLPNHPFSVIGRPPAWDVKEPDDLRFDGVLGLQTLAATRAVYDVAGRTLYMAAKQSPGDAIAGTWRVTGEREDGFCGGLLGRQVRVAGGRMTVTRSSGRAVLDIRPDPNGRPDCLTLVCPDLGLLGVRVRHDGDTLTLLVGRHPAPPAAEGTDGLTTVTLRRVGGE